MASDDHATTRRQMLRDISAGALLASADTPLGRPGQPAELAPLYVLLASRESSYSTGQVFGAVGGRGGP
jgi:NAD(P)-dependent dehydrogenase (short-subunit alcohol dehydrogenase family)